MQTLHASSRSFWLLWFGTVASFLGGSLARIVLPVYVARETGSPLSVSAIVFGFTAPRLVFGLPLGLLVDRLDRRGLLIGAYACRAATLALLAGAALADQGQLAIGLLAAVIIGAAEVVDEPAATALVPAIVPGERLDSANRRFVAAEMVVEIVSQPVGGLLLGASLLLAVSAGGLVYLAGIAGLLLLAGSFRPVARERRPLRADVLAGLALIWRQPVLRAISLMAAVINACWTAWMVAFILHALAPGPLGLDEWRLGLLLGADGIGGAIGVASVGFVLGRLGRRWAIGINIAGNALMFLAPLLTADVWLLALAIAIGGIGSPPWGVVTRTLQQRITPDHLLGRVSSAYRMLAHGANAVGTLVGGLVAQVWGLEIVFLGAGLLTLAMFAPFQRAITARAFDGAAPRAA